MSLSTSSARSGTESSPENAVAGESLNKDGNSNSGTASNQKDFPVLGLLPKQETQAWELLSKFPEYDGRGVKVAIFDTGVDPAASGLQVCPDGRPKVVDIVDCTGSGDVDTSTVVKEHAAQVVEGVREIKGLSGRSLRLNPKWSSSSGEWRVGMKRAYELFPKMLVNRVKKQRRKEWDKNHQAAEAAVARDISAWKAAHASPTPTEKKFLQDLEARAAYLEECKGTMDDPGPLHDCVVWKGFGGLEEADVGEGAGEERWWAAVDTEEDGDLTEAVAMTDFDKFRQYGRFSDVACLNFGVHVYDDGDVLSLVVDAGAHGTHVAGIVAAYYPDDPEANGVAPGAQIVSLKIGDSRLGSMETGTGVVRAVTEAVRMGCDVINMSYGEAAALCDSGRVAVVVREAALKHGMIFLASVMNAGPALSTVQAPGGTSSGLIGVGAYAAVELAREAVCKHRIVFVASAGNNGPAITTSGAPGSTTPDLLSVGAYASPSLMSASFSMRENLEGGKFTWTSAGPTADGDTGVSIMAPGGAIAPVPNWTLQKKQLMMGTSMASPNCAGVVSLLISAMKQKFPEKTLSVHRVRRALENTAKRLPDLEAVVQGQGLVQVSSALDYLVKHVHDDTEDVQFQVTVNNNRRGVYLRQLEDVSRKSQWAVTVKPLLHEDDHNDRRTEFEMRLRLSCDVPGVECASDLALLHSGRVFVIAIDPTKFDPGFHHTSIKAYDVAAPDKGPMFRVPLTALIPTKPKFATVPKGGLSATLFGPQGKGDGSHFGPGKVTRRFIHPPHGASWMDVEVTDCRDASNAPDGTRRMMVLHCLQLLPETPYRDAECQKYLNMNPGQREVHSMRLEPCAAVEICLAQNWSAIGPTSAEVSVTFRGVSPSPGTVTLQGGCSHAQVIVSAPLGMQDLAPAGSLSKWSTTIAPTKGTISALGQRDVTPDGRQGFCLLLEYSFKQTEAGEVTPRLAALNGILYDNEYEGQMYMIFDSNKKLMAVGDCWPEAVKLSKGDYVVRVQVRHPEQSMLKRLKSHPLMLTRKLANSISVAVHGTMTSVSTSGKPPAPVSLSKGHSVSYHFAEPPQDKLPKAVKPGDLFTGTAYYVRNKTNRGGEGRRPGGYPILYTAGPAKATESSTDNAAPAPSSPTLPPPTAASAANVASKDDASKDVDKDVSKDASENVSEDPLTETETPAAPPTEADKMVDALRDLRVKFLEGCKAEDADAFQQLYNTARDQIKADGRTDPETHLPLLSARLHFLDREGIRRGRQKERQETEDATTDAAAAADSEKAPVMEGNDDEALPSPDAEVGKPQDEHVIAALRAVVGAADDLVAKIDQVDVARQLGTNLDPEDAAMVSERAEVDEKKAALADAFARKARALAEMETLSGEAEMTKISSPFLAAYSNLLRWADVSEDKHARVALAFLLRKKRLGMMVKLLTKLISSSSKTVPKEEGATERAKVFKELGWEHLVQGDKKWAVLGHPPSYALF